MDLAWALFQQGWFPEFAFVRAETQTHGRGRFGRAWVSAPGNLFVTLRLPDSAGILDTLLPLALGLTLVRALEPLRVPARIKWPNDVLIGFSKVGGILVEKKGPVIMAGLGVNISSAPESSLGEKFFHIKSGCLAESGVNLEPSELWALILEQIKGRIPGMMSDPSTVVEHTGAVLAFKGETVVLEETGDSDGPARITGIDAQGGLIIETIKGIRSIRRGRIVPRVV
jgi:BirA family biotin operon repressor/biotin-[acetyl-CoA-carboxylase] ligase